MIKCCLISFEPGSISFVHVSEFVFINGQHSKLSYWAGEFGLNDIFFPDVLLVMFAVVLTPFYRIDTDVFEELTHDPYLSSP